MGNQNLTYTVGEVAVLASIGGAIIGGVFVGCWMVLENPFWRGVIVGALAGAGLMLATVWSAGWRPSRG